MSGKIFYVNSFSGIGRWETDESEFEEFDVGIVERWAQSRAEKSKAVKKVLIKIELKWKFLSPKMPGQLKSAKKKK